MKLIHKPLVKEYVRHNANAPKVCYICLIIYDFVLYNVWQIVLNQKISSLQHQAWNFQAQILEPWKLLLLPTLRSTNATNFR